MSRYLTRAPVALGKVHPQKDGRIKLLTPRDPATGLDHRFFGPLDWVRAVTTQIPDPRQHMVRCYGAYANRVRQLIRPAADASACGVAAPSASRPDEDRRPRTKMETRVPRTRHQPPPPPTSKALTRS